MSKSPTNASPATVDQLRAENADLRQQVHDLRQELAAVHGGERPYCHADYKRDLQDPRYDITSPKYDAAFRKRVDEEGRRLFDFERDDSLFERSWPNERV